MECNPMRLNSNNRSKQMIQRKISQTALCGLLSLARFAIVYGVKSRVSPNFFANKIWVFFKADFQSKNTHVFLAFKHVCRYVLREFSRLQFQNFRNENKFDPDFYDPYRPTWVLCAIHNIMSLSILFVYYKNQT